MYAFFIKGEELIIPFSVFKVKPFSLFQFRTVVKEVCFLQGNLQHWLVIKGAPFSSICHLVKTLIRPLQGKAVFIDEIKKISSVNIFCVWCDSSQAIWKHINQDPYPLSKRNPHQQAKSQGSSSRLRKYISGGTELRQHKCLNTPKTTKRQVAFFE